MTEEEANRIVDEALGPFRNSEMNIVGTPRRFCGFVVASLRLALPAAVVTPRSPENVEITQPGHEGKKRLHLGRIHNDLLHNFSRDALVALVQRLEALISYERPERQPLAGLTDRIVPIVKSSAFANGNAANIRAEALASGHDPELAAKLNWTDDRGLRVFPAVDYDEGFDFVTEFHRRGAGIPAEEIRRLAMDNLARAYAASDRSLPFEGDSHEITGLGGFTMSLVLLDGFLEDMAAKAGEGFYLFSGGTDHLFLVRLSSPEFASHVLRKIALGGLEQGDLAPMVYDQGRLTSIDAHDAAPPRRPGRGPGRR